MGRKISICSVLNYNFKNNVDLIGIPSYATYKRKFTWPCAAHRMYGLTRGCWTLQRMARRRKVGSSHWQVNCRVGMHIHLQAGSMPRPSQRLRGSIHRILLYMLHQPRHHVRVCTHV